LSNSDTKRKGCQLILFSGEFGTLKKVENIIHPNYLFSIL